MRKEIILVFIAFAAVTGVIFRHYLFDHQVPFPSNLLVSFYQPWASYPKENYQNVPPAKPIGFDALRSFYPTRTLVTQSLKSGKLPLWNPFSFSGNTLLGVYQSAIFHPFSFLFLLLPQIDAWSIIILLTPILTGAFTYLLLRELNISKWASLFGAVTFAFSGIMIVWWEEMFMATYSFLVLPLVLFALLKLLTSQAKWPFVLLVISLAWSILSGWFQATFYVFIASGLWAVYLIREMRPSIKKIALIMIGFFTSLLVSSIQLVPSLEAYLNSARQSIDTREMFQQFFAPLEHLVTFIAPDYFGSPAVHNYFSGAFYHERVIGFGIVGLFFVIYEFLQWKLLSTKEKFFIFVGFAALSLGFSLPTSWFFLYTLKLPFLNEMTPTRIFFLSSFSFSVLSAYGIDRLLKKPNMKVLLLVSFILVAIFIAALIPPIMQTNFTFQNFTDRSMITLRNLVIPAGVLVLTWIAILIRYYPKRGATYCAIGAICTSCIGFVLFANKYLYFSERQFVFPQIPVLQKLREIQGIDRFWSIGDGYMFRNFANQDQLYSPEGYESFNIQKYSELVFSSHTKGIYPSSVLRADVQLYTAKNLKELEDNPYTKRVMMILGVRYILAKNTSENPAVAPSFKRIWSDDIYAIYEYKEALPRYFFAADFIIKSSPQDILDAIYKPGIDLKKTLILETKPGEFAPSSTPASGTIKLLTYDTGDIRFSSESTGSALLFLSDTYYPGWQARIDNKETPIYRTDYAFRSIVVPPGNHIIAFVYKPLSVTIGGILSLLGIVLCIALWFLSPYFLKKE